MEHIAAVDWVIISLVLISTLISIVRGFVKEALSLATLIAAILIARLFGAQVGTMLEDFISVPSLRMAVAYGGLYLVTMIIGGMINYLIYQVVRMAGLSTINRILGMGFGFLRGALIVVVAVALMARMPVSEDDWWRSSQIIPHVLVSADWLQIFVVDKIDEFKAHGIAI